VQPCSHSVTINLSRPTQLQARPFAKALADAYCSWVANKLVYDGTMHSSNTARMIVQNTLVQRLSCLRIYRQQELSRTNDTYVNRTVTAIGSCSARLHSRSVGVTATSLTTLSSEADSAAAVIKVSLTIRLRFATNGQN